MEGEQRVKSRKVWTDLNCWFGVTSDDMSSSPRRKRRSPLKFLPKIRRSPSSRLARALPPRQSRMKRKRWRKPRRRRRRLRAMSWIRPLQNFRSSERLSLSSLLRDDHYGTQIPCFTKDFSCFCGAPISGWPTRCIASTSRQWSGVEEVFRSPGCSGE